MKLYKKKDRIRGSYQKIGHATCQSTVSNCNLMQSSLFEAQVNERSFITNSKAIRKMVEIGQIAGGGPSNFLTWYSFRMKEVERKSNWWRWYRSRYATTDGLQVTVSEFQASDYQFVEERPSVWECKKRKKQHANCKKFRVVRFSFIVNDCSIPRTISECFHLRNFLWSYCCAATTVSRTMHLPVVLYERAGASSRTCPSLCVIETCRDFVDVVATQFLFFSRKTRTLYLVACSSSRDLEMG